MDSGQVLLREGTFGDQFIVVVEGRLGEVPVYNVSVPVMGEDWWVFELAGDRRAPSEVH